MVFDLSVPDFSYLKNVTVCLLSLMHILKMSKYCDLYPACIALEVPKRVLKVYFHTNKN